MPSDFDLLERWAHGDKAAADALVRRHYASVLRFFDVRLPAAADDLTQKTFLACVESVDRLVDRSSFRAFLFGIARNNLLMHLRTKRRAVETFGFDDLQSRETGVATPSRVVAMYEEQRLLMRALQAITPEAQTLLQMFYWEGMSNREIGVAIDAPLSTVTTRISRARQALARAVAEIPGLERDRSSLLQGLDSWIMSIASLDLAGVGAASGRQP